MQPQLALEAEQPPEGPGWLHELKLDGYRMQARKSARGVQMLTRSGLDWTYRVPAVAEAVARLQVQNVTLDGEVVVLADDGTTLIVVDGYEQLSRWNRWRLRRYCRRKGLGLLITAHADMGLPWLYRTQCDQAIALAVVERLLSEHADTIDETLRRALIDHGH